LLFDPTTMMLVFSTALRPHMASKDDEARGIKVIHKLYRKMQLINRCLRK